MGDMYECPQAVRVAAQLPPRAPPPLSRYGPTTAAPKRDVKLAAPRSDPTSSDDYECPAAVVIRPQPVRTAPMVSSSPRPTRRANNYSAGAPKRTNSSGEKTSYRASFLIFTLLMVLSVSLQVSAFILSMSAGNDAEELRGQNVLSLVLALVLNDMLDLLLALSPNNMLDLLLALSLVLNNTLDLLLTLSLDDMLDRLLALSPDDMLDRLSALSWMTC
ncbi:Hypp4816 [Branchiostoma lanceolatum]|uniref:Hypp4816 protein n=1 Tax=Branchiostoma lanceolatum TaxID=7740 RepID=A0A8K0ABH4_BRALA|nr:Hypp4816 [Branchiostoma lanceolatum]